MVFMMTIGSFCPAEGLVSSGPRLRSGYCVQTPGDDFSEVLVSGQKFIDHLKLRTDRSLHPLPKAKDLR
jgi:hypothetical protein